MNFVSQIKNIPFLSSLAARERKTVVWDILEWFQFGCEIVNIDVIETKWKVNRDESETNVFSSSTLKSGHMKVKFTVNSFKSSRKFTFS